ncbi:ABC transporter permease [Actinoplanes auranticolor]|uniref:ABC transporter permease n=1 Tax=Actinoplanes auranticolor TaxID=47988 RepID=A0A919SU55_9ACTN|nr:ABC transporter permease [Actinoplanes auranticolor]GIM78616.1 ABC transporter permease [Actinoplanes auranticolor]
MTAPTLAPSAYPPDLAELIPQARDLAAELGEIPSQNRLKKTLKVGTPKARAVLAALTAPPAGEPTTNPVDTEPDTPPTPVDPVPDTETTPTPEPLPEAMPDVASPQLAPVTDPEPPATPTDPAALPADAVPEDVKARRPVVWPVLILCLPAFVAIWAGWVEMGRLTGFGKVALLPGIADSVVLDTAITLPIGVETYAAYALWAWLSGRAPQQARRFAKCSAIASLAVGALGQIAYHLMAAAGWSTAPWLITAVVACIPVAVLGMGAALAHLMHSGRN